LKLRDVLGTRTRGCSQEAALALLVVLQASRSVVRRFGPVPYRTLTGVRGFEGVLDSTRRQMAAGGTGGTEGRGGGEGGGGEDEPRSGQWTVDRVQSTEEYTGDTWARYLGGELHAAAKKDGGKLQERKRSPKASCGWGVEGEGPGQVGNGQLGSGQWALCPLSVAKGYEDKAQGSRLKTRDSTQDSGKTQDSRSKDQVDIGTVHVPRMYSTRLLRILVSIEDSYY
jgi:hypothetical protein